MTFKAWCIVAVVVLLLGEACGILWLWKGKDEAKALLIAAQTQVHDKQGEIDDQKATIRHLTDYKAANDGLLASFMAEIKRLRSGDAQLQNDIANLRRTDPNVERYLSTPIPAALADLLNRGLRAPGPAPAAQGH